MNLLIAAQSRDVQVTKPGAHVDDETERRAEYWKQDWLNDAVDRMVHSKTIPQTQTAVPPTVPTAAPTKLPTQTIQQNSHKSSPPVTHIASDHPLAGASIHPLATMPHVPNSVPVTNATPLVSLPSDSVPSFQGIPPSSTSIPSSSTSASFPHIPSFPPSHPLQQPSFPLDNNFQSFHSNLVNGTNNRQM
jgi:hypothetical protein